MNRVIKVLQSMINHIEHLTKTTTAPTTEQLTHKVKEISSAIKKEICSMHKRIKEIVSIAFMEMGWNALSEKCINAKSFTLSSFRSTLVKVLNQFENWSPTVLPTPSELSNFSMACDRLWELDIHRLVPEVDYVLNFQSGKQVYNDVDMANLPLFTFVDEKVFMKPTYASFIQLLDNYNETTGVKEVVTNEERLEENLFLNMIMDTAVMQYMHQYLLTTGKTKALDRNDFISELNELWFGLYTRKARNDSCGFEHVFVGEIKADRTPHEIIGFHNWIRIYLEEKKIGSKFDYRGYIKPTRRSIDLCYPKTHQQLATIQFDWNGAFKSASTSFFGTSPEFEMALYTLCFYFGNTENHINLGPYKVKITCHKWYNKEKNKEYVATCFPAETPLNDHEAATKIQSQYRCKLKRNRNVL